MMLVRSLAAAILSLALAGPAHAEPTPDIVYPDDPELQQAYESGFDDGAFRGYDDGFAAGVVEGEEQGREAAEREAEESDLRDDVEVEAEKTEEPPVVEGGQDVADTSPGFVEPEPDGPGFPWWPLSFAVVATVWFVTRRRRLDESDAD